MKKRSLGEQQVLLQELSKEMLSKYRPEGAEYINKEGVWETWFDTHGSGFTEYYGEASPEALALDAAFSVLSEELCRRVKEEREEQEQKERIRREVEKEVLARYTA